MRFVSFIWISNNVRMKFFRFVLLLSLCFPGFVSGNNTSSREVGNIVLTPMIASNTSIPKYAQTLMLNKLSQIVVRNGVQGYSPDGRFVITANIVEISREITPTIPSMIAIVLKPMIFIGDISEDKLFSCCELKNVKGVGKTEEKAFMNAFNSISINAKEIDDCVEKGKIKILEYYNSKGEAILDNAKVLANQGQYDAALLQLLTIPEVCNNLRSSAMDLAAVIFKEKIDVEGRVLLNEAEQAWNSNQSFSGAEKAASFLSRIHPLSSSMREAEGLSTKIAKRIRELEKREWSFKMQQYKDEQYEEQKRRNYEHAEKMALIKAAKDVGVAYASRPVSYSYSYTRINWW